MELLCIRILTTLEFKKLLLNERKSPGAHYQLLSKDYKQLLDEVFVKSEIIKVEVSGISRAEGQG